MRLIITDGKSLGSMVKNELIVVIDVLRAFTTACYAMNNNPKNYIVIRDLKLAYKLKKENPEYVLIGEREGFKLPGFDYGNSPVEIKNVDFSTKTIIQTTTLGTKGIDNALKYTDDVITGSFANAKAIISYIRNENPENVYLFPTNGLENENEDLMFAKYIKGYFESKPLNVNSIRDNLMIKRSGIEYLTDPRTEYSKNDFFLSFEPDKFNFILKAYFGKDGLIRLKKVDL
jgi:2-phosphosulfolactate phosphatase